MKKSRYSYCFVLVALSLARAFADEGELLVGHLSPLKDEVTSASDVVVGKFTRIRAGTAESITGMIYHGQITILRTLKGNESGSLEVVFQVIRGRKDTEGEPNLDDAYIIVLVQHHGIRKLIVATDSNITEVKALIAASTK